MNHPQAIGFTPRYEWHGRQRVIVWAHCGAEARQGSTRHVEGGRTDSHSVVTCDSCGLRYESACLWDRVLA